LHAILSPLDLIHAYCQALNPNSLLDLAFSEPVTASDNLPDAQYLPALEKQKQLEALLLAQQARRLFFDFVRIFHWGFCSNN
jgi:hypothetical protein